MLEMFAIFVIFALFGVVTIVVGLCLMVGRWAWIDYRAKLRGHTESEQK